MSNYNKVILEGRVGQAPKTNDANTVTRISLATDKNIKDKEGNWQKKTFWHNIVFFGPQAEYIAKNIVQGTTLRIEGSIEYGEYTNKENVKVKYTEINANRFDVMRKPASESASQEATAEPEFDEANPPF